MPNQELILRHEAALDLPTPSEIEMQLELGRDALLNADPIEALPHYLRVVDQPESIIDPAVQFQIALAFEAVGAFDNANALYQILSRGSDKTYAAAAQIGLCGGAIAANRPELAMQTLWRELLSPRQTSGIPADAAHWLGGLLEEMIESNELDLAKFPMSLADIPVHFEPDRILRRLLAQSKTTSNNSAAVSPSPEADLSNSSSDWIQLDDAPTDADGHETPAANDTSASTQPDAGREPVCQIEPVVIGPQLSNTIVNITANGVDVAHLLAAIALKINKEIKISERGVQGCAGFEPSIRLDAIGLATVLDGLTIPYSLVWFEQDGVCYVVAAEELKPNELRSFRIDSARRMLQLALLEAPQHEMATHNQLAMANVDFWRGDIYSAIAAYRSAIEHSSDQYLTQCAYFNLAKILRYAANYEHAIDAFYHVVESTTNTDLLSAGYLCLGQTLLELDRLDEAIRAFDRAVKLSVSDSASQTAIVDLAITHILADEPALALQALMNGKQRLKEARFQNLARFLGFYARWVLAGDERSAEEMNLISSLGAASDPCDIGPQEPLLYSQAFQQLGFLSEAEDQIDQANRWKMATPMECRLQLSLADCLLRQQQYDEATKILVLLAANGDADNQNQALLRICSIEYQTGHLEKAFASCKQLLDRNPDKKTQIEALRLLGMIHQKWNNPDQAALCFAGLLPTPNNKDETPPHE